MRVNGDGDIAFGSHINPIRICLPSDTLSHFSVSPKCVPSVKSIVFGWGDGFDTNETQTDSKYCDMFKTEDELIQHKLNKVDSNDNDDDSPIFMQLSVVVSLCSLGFESSPHNAKSEEGGIHFEIHEDSFSAEDLKEDGDMPSSVEPLMLNDEINSHVHCKSETKEAKLKDPDYNGYLETDEESSSEREESEGLTSVPERRKREKYKKNMGNKQPPFKSEFVCDTCGRFFKSAVNLQNHVERGHDQTRLLNCPNCDAVFNKRGHFRKHLRSVHNQTKDKICPICSRAFSKKTFLTDHINAKHSDKDLRNFKCHLCTFRSFKPFHLQKHIRLVHEKQRPFPCHLCSKEFASKYALEVHVKATHDQVRDEMCSMCGVAFACKHRLMLHIKQVHEQVGSKFKCYHCQSPFDLRSELTRHLKTEHGGVPNFTCSICKKGSTSDSSLKKHMRIFHKDVVRKVAIGNDGTVVGGELLKTENSTDHKSSE